MIDASIPLQAQGPQNPLAQYGQALALQNAMQQNQAGNLHLQQQQMEMQDQQKLKQAYSEAKGDLAQTEQNAIRLGVGPNTLLKVKQQLLDQRSKLAEVDEKELKVKKEHTEAIGSAAQSVLQLAPEKRSAAWAATRAGLIQQGRIKPEEAPEQYPGDEAVQGFANTARTSQQIIDSVFKERETKAQEQNAATGVKREAREGEKQDFETGQKKRADLAAKLGTTKTPAEYQKILGAAPFEIAQEFAGKTPEQARQMGLTAEQQTQAAQAATNAQQTAARDKVQEQQGAQRIGVSQAELGLRNKEYQQKYGDVLGQLSPSQKSIAEKLASGDMRPTDLSRYPDKEKLMAAAIAINPGWTQATYDAKQSFTNPEKSQAKNLGTISRIVGHIGRFEENSKKMGFAPAYASGMRLTGDQNKLSEDSHAIAAELEKLVSGGVGTMEQTKAWQKSLSSPSANARQQAVDEISQLIGSQYEGMNQTYKAAIGVDLPTEKYVSQAGRDWMTAKGINVAGAKEAAATPNAPAVGTIEGGHKFKGGNPADPKSWEKVN